jgi:hypothetical protein
MNCEHKFIKIRWRRKSRFSGLPIEHQVCTTIDCFERARYHCKICNCRKCDKCFAKLKEK